ncbi:MAG: hypothetical protein VX738_09595 [Planctomycetota bacterium]|nr:hypothetical protein [Planctomycetota bacterium]
MKDQNANDPSLQSITAPWLQDVHDGTLVKIAFQGKNRKHWHPFGSYHWKNTISQS